MKHTNRLPNTNPIQNPRKLLRVPCIPSLPDQTINPQSTHKQKVHLLAPCEQLGADVQIRIDHPCRIEQCNAHMKWGGMTVVDPETFEGLCKRGHVGGHV